MTKAPLNKTFKKMQTQPLTFESDDLATPDKSTAYDTSIVNIFDSSSTIKKVSYV